MTSFSPSERQTIAGFAGHLGLEARMAQDGTCSFVFQSTGTLTLTPSREGGRTIVSLARKIGWFDGALLLRALSKAGYDPARGRVLHVGLAVDDDVLFMISLDEGEMSLPSLEDCLQQLKAAHDALH